MRSDRDEPDRGRPRRGGSAPSSRSTGRFTRRPGKTRACRSCSPAALEAPVCVFARDLGKDEVAAGEPLIGAGGRLVRAGLYEAKFGEPPQAKSDRTGRRGARVARSCSRTPCRSSRRGTRHTPSPRQGAVPAVPRGVARRPLERGRPGDLARHRGVPVVRPLRRRPSQGGFEEFWKRARIGTRPRSRATLTVFRRGSQGRKTVTLLPLAPPVATQSTVVRPVPRVARRTIIDGSVRS